MKQFVDRYLSPACLPFFILCSSILGFILRFWLLTAAVDHRGLIVSGHIADIFSWILTAIVLVALLIGTEPLKEASKYRFNFPPFLQGGLGSCLAAFGILITSLVEFIQKHPSANLLTFLLGLLCAAILTFTGFCRLKGIHPSPLFHSIVCIYLTLFLFGRYRMWSSDPQLQDYVFELLAIICLMLASYHRAAFDANFGNRRWYSFFAFAAFYFCMVCLPGCSTPPFFGGCAIWMITNLPSLRTVSRTNGKDGSYGTAPLRSKMHRSAE